jgi:hypothetical protein
MYLRFLTSVLKVPDDGSDEPKHVKGKKVKPG